MCDCSYLIFEKIAAFSPDSFAFPRSVDDVTKVGDRFLSSAGHYLSIACERTSRTTRSFELQ